MQLQADNLKDSIIVLDSICIFDDSQKTTTFVSPGRWTFHTTFLTTDFDSSSDSSGRRLLPNKAKKHNFHEDIDRKPDLGRHNFSLYRYEVHPVDNILKGGKRFLWSVRKRTPVRVFIFSRQVIVRYIVFFS